MTGDRGAHSSQQAGQRQLHGLRAGALHLTLAWRCHPSDPALVSHINGKQKAGRALRDAASPHNWCAGGRCCQAIRTGRSVRRVWSTNRWLSRFAGPQGLLAALTHPAAAADQQALCGHNAAGQQGSELWSWERPCSMGRHGGDPGTTVLAVVR
jgi:hypothetical protein